MSSAPRKSSSGSARPWPCNSTNSAAHRAQREGPRMTEASFTRLLESNRTLLEEARRAREHRVRLLAGIREAFPEGAGIDLPLGLRLLWAVVERVEEEMRHAE